MAIDKKLIDQPLPPNVLTDGHSGYPPEAAAGDNRETLMAAADDAGAAITAFSNAWYIEPNERLERARFNLENKMRACDYINRFTNQQPTHECTCHSLSRGAEAAWNRARRIAIGPPVADTKLEVPVGASPVWLSPLSVYSEANPGQWGGASIRGVLNIAARRGFLPEPIQPKEYGFKHTLHGTTGEGNVTQSRGAWVSVSRFPAGWEETAKHFKPLEFIFPETLDQAICLILHGLIVCVGRDGHAVPWGDVDFDRKVIPYWDSYDIVRYDSFDRAKRAISNGGAFAIVNMTTPDDWNNPAGNPVPLSAA